MVKLTPAWGRTPCLGSGVLLGLGEQDCPTLTRIDKGHLNRLIGHHRHMLERRVSQLMAGWGDRLHHPVFALADGEEVADTGNRHAVVDEGVFGSGRTADRGVVQ